MKKYKLILFIFIIFCGLIFSKNSLAVVADHTIISQFYSLSPSKLSSAAAKTLLFYHQSTGNGVEFYGLDCLNGLHSGWSDQPAECINNSLYNPYDDRKWDWLMWPEPQSDAIAKMDQFVSRVNADNNNHQVYGMKFCFVDAWNLDFVDYSQKMINLENSHPGKIFIWTTAIFWGGSDSRNEIVQDFNIQVRNYAKNNNWPLLDLGYIESKGGTCRSGGFETVCNEYIDGPGGAPDGHVDNDGALAMAKGLWWLMANLNSTPGPSATPMPSVTPNPSPTATPKPSVTPTPVATPSPSVSPSPNPADINGDGKIDFNDIKLILTSWLGLGNCGSFNCNLNNDGKINALDFAFVLKNIFIPVPTPSPSASPSPTPGATSTITFNEYTVTNISGTPLNGEFPTGIVNWGSGVWILSVPWDLFTTTSVYFNQTSANFSFINPKTLLSVKAYNGGTNSSTITLSCTGNTTRTQAVTAKQMLTINTNWTVPCTQVTVTSSNGGDTNFDDFIYQ